jgi:hypothetical protein
MKLQDISERKGGHNRINYLHTHSKNKNIRDVYRGIREFKKGYQPKINLMKDENGDLLAGSYSILNRWKNYLSRLLMYVGLVMLGRGKYIQQNH